MKLTPAYLSANFENVRDLESIKLSGRDITHIDDISFLVNLKRLDLSGNKLRSGESLSGLQYCKSLTWLDLSGNQLSEFHHLLCLRNLSVLNLSRNAVELIPEEISQLTSLKALILSENQIKTLANATLPKGLNTLVLSKNCLKDVGKALLPLGQLEKLSLSHNSLHVWPRVSLSGVLRELRLNKNMLFKLPKSVAEFPPELSLVDIGHNAVDEEAELAGIVALRHLTSLNIKGNPVCNEKLEADLVKRIPSLQVLNARKVRERQGPRRLNR